MKKIFFSIVIITVVLITGLSNISAVKLNNLENQKLQTDNNEKTLGWLRIEGGQCYVTVNNEVGGQDNTIYVTHGEDITLFVEWELVDDSVHFPEFWEFYGRLSPVDKYGNYHQFGISKDDILLDDDSCSGIFEITVKLEAFVNKEVDIYGHMGGYWRNDLLNLTNSKEKYLPDLKLISINTEPDKPDKPSGPTTIKYPCEKTYTINEPSDPDGDDIIEYEWLLERERDDFDEETITTTNEAKISFPDHSGYINNQETYYLKVRVKDEIYNTWSPWSDQITISAQKKSKDTFNQLLQDFSDFKIFKIIFSYYLSI